MYPILRIVFVFVVAVLGNLAFQILFMLLLPAAVPALLTYFAALGFAILAARLAWVKTASRPSVASWATSWWAPSAPARWASRSAFSGP